MTVPAFALAGIQLSTVLVIRSKQASDPREVNIARHDTLVGEVAERTATVEILCSKCERRGRDDVLPGHDAGYPFRSDMRAVMAFVLAGIMAVLMVTTSAASSGPLWFSDVRNSDDEQAKRYMEENVGDALSATSGMAAELVRSVSDAGARCQLLRDFCNEYWCTYEAAAPGLVGRFLISRELQVIVVFEDSGKVTSVKVFIARTGP